MNDAMRLDALKHIIDKLELAAGGRDERLSVTVDCHGYEEYIGNDVINAAVEELDAVSAPSAWSGDPPKVAGGYWVRPRDDHSRRHLWEITDADIANPPMCFRLFEFSGPFPEPKEGGRGVTQHEMKVWPEYFRAVKSGAKPFEIRHEHDRRFEIGDFLYLREWDPDTEDYTGDEVYREVTYILRDAFFFGVRPNHAILGLRESTI